MKNRSFFFDRFVMKRNYRELMISLELGDHKIKDLAKRTGIAYQHLSCVLQEAQKEGMILSKRKDHSLNFSLTQKGEAVKELCLGLKMCIENWEDDKTIANLNKLGFIKKQQQKKDNDPKIPKKSGNVITEPQV